jgi:intracellular sulfur oxidation DsrE/DsrF family protein
MNKLILIWIVILFGSTTVFGGSQADEYNNDNALRGLKETKAYFDVTLGEPKKVLLRLQLIDMTYNQLANSGVSPVFIIGIRGKSSNFFTKGADYVLDIDLPEKKQIAALAKKLKAQDIDIEQCRIAAGLQEIEVADFISEVDIVANGYTSMIGYQAKGYGLVPMD